MFLNTSIFFIKPSFVRAFLLGPRGTFLDIEESNTTVIFRGLILVAFFCFFSFDMTQPSKGLKVFEYARLGADFDGKSVPRM